MKYRNTKTGAVICTRCKVTGEVWEPLTDSRQTPPAETQDTPADDESTAETENDSPAEPTAKAAVKTAKTAPKRSGKKGA